jgi:hypothetical protein
VNEHLQPATLRYLAALAAWLDAQRLEYKEHSRRPYLDHPGDWKLLCGGLSHRTARARAALAAATSPRP